MPLAAPAGLALGLVLAWAQALPLAEGLASGFALFAAAWLFRPLLGIRRWACQLVLIPPAYVLTLTADPSQRLMLFQALVGLAAATVLATRTGAHTAASRPERALGAAVPLVSAIPMLWTKFGWGTLWSLAAPAAAAAAPTPWGLAAVLGGWALTSPTHPGVAAGWVAGWVLLGQKRRQPAASGVVLRWLVPLLAFGLAGAVFLPYGGLLAFPGFSMTARGLAAFAGLAVLTAFLPPRLAAGAWVLGFWLGMSPLPVPPDRPGPTLTAEAPEASLPPGSSGVLYTLEVSLAHAGRLPGGTPVARLDVGGEEVTLRAGRDACEWALLREDVGASRGHGLPRTPVFRPSREAPWAVGGRVELYVPAGVAPRIVREATLPAPVTVAVLQAGPQLPTPKRALPASSVLSLALAAVVLFLPWLGSTAWALWPLGLLALGRLCLFLPLEPLRILAERHGVDLGLAAFVAAWALAFARRLLDHRWLPGALALVLPLSLLAPQLSQLMGDEPYAVAIAESLVRDGDLDVRNNVDPERYPLWVVELSREAQGRFLHSPLLGVLLAPGYLLAGRTGMVVGIGILAWLSLVALGRRAWELGLSRRRVALGLFVVLSSYPFLLFATELWVEMPAVAALSWQLVWAAEGRVSASATVAVLATLAKTRLGLLTVPLAGAALWRRWRRVWVWAAVGTAAVGAVALVAAALWFGNPLDPLGRRALSHLIPRDPGQPLRVVFGLLFDAAYGLGFAAPVWLLALFGLCRLWRRGGAGERALLLGSAATVAALLSYVEWRGGGSPPFRYLVPLLPAFFLGLVHTWRRPWGRGLTVVSLPPTLLVAWVSLTRPAMLYNIGDGGQWLADRLASRLAADARHFFPSYLRISPASLVAPAVIGGLGVLLWWAFRAWPRGRRWAMREATGLWLTAGCALIVALSVVPDRVVELEDPQVEHLGGALEPHPGAWSRFLSPNGWRLFSGDGVAVPLHLPAARALRLSGWVDGASGGELCATFDRGPLTCVAVAPGPVRISLPAPAPGRHRLTLAARLPEGTSLVLDKLEVRR